jgi:hypothetical protein
MTMYQTFYITRMKLALYEVQPMYKNKFTDLINTMRMKKFLLNYTF